MFIVSLEYIKDLVAAGTYLAEYIVYLERYYQAGIFVMSGRKQSRTGSVILVEVSSREQVEKLITEDSSHQEGVAEYMITEFIPTEVAEGLEDCLEAT